MDHEVIKIEAGSDLRQAMQKAVDGLGGFGCFLTKGDKVLVKPNFNTADPFPASSDREFVAVFLDLCREAGAGEIILGESCTYYLKTEQVMDKWGCHELRSGRPWLQVVDFDKGQWVRKTVPQGKYLKSVSLPAVLDEVDRLFILPCLKTHKYAQYTGALKLAVGLMKPGERLSLHVRKLQEKIAEMNSVIQPDLIVMDARKCFINRGPTSGEVKQPGLIMASADRVAIDVEGVRIIQGYAGNDLAGVVPEELPQIKRAREMGVDQNTAPADRR